MLSAMLDDNKYPKALKEISNPPERLYYKGELIAEEKCFAVVGTRRCSSYGKQAALDITGDLSEAGLTIVSGIASGIDTFAHLAAVERGKRTIAVLGTGLDKDSFYPKKNIPLSEEIIKTGGCLMSEYAPGTRGSQFTFPQRNRIISGLCLGILVVEAKQRSGALITAGWARKQKRKIFALPGSIYFSNSEGCHWLIKQGAQIADGASTILKSLNLSFQNQQEDIEGENKEEGIILQSLKQGPLYLDKIIEKTKLPAAAVASIISVLEIKKKIRNLGNNTFSLNR